MLLGDFFWVQLHVQIKKKTTAKAKREAKQPKGSVFKINS